MSSIGPQLPPHLAKRKRIPEDDEDASTGSPPNKIRASEAGAAPPKNKDEIALDDDDLSDDDGGGYGPSAPQTASRPVTIGPTLPPSSSNLTKSTIGPSLPPAPPHADTDEIPLDDSASEEEDVGPAHLTTTTTTTTTTAAAAAAKPKPKPKRIHGPAPPLASLDEQPPGNPNSDSSDSEDDDYGPALPTSFSHQARQSQASAAAALEAAHPKALVRDDWMLAPPTAGGAYRAPDPTKLKARKFNSGPRSGAGSASGGAGEQISSIWTETPEQKRKRLENAVLGREDASSYSAAAAAASARTGASTVSREEQERLDKIRSTISASRGPSLYEEHQRREGGKDGRIEQEEDDPSKRAFNWEKDMKLGGRISSKQRNELLNRASDFGGRFSKGKYL